jgi:hypothetical protein
MPTFLDRYLAGEHEQVWRDLINLGPAIRQDSTLLVDARAVATATMRRVSHNLALLVPRLRDAGYRFAYDDTARQESGGWWGADFPVHDPPAASAAENLDAIERTFGPLPLSVRAFYEHVGAVNLIGTHPDWPDIEILDPLVVGPLPARSELADEYEDWQDQEPEEPFTLDLAPDSYHKADISGGPSYGVEFPCSAADAVLKNERHHLAFVDYLRLALAWAGLPGFDRLPPADVPRDVLTALTADFVDF